MVRGIVTENYSRLKRPGNIMPQDVEEALEQHGLMGEYKNRPAYQRNDYLSWINQAVRPETRQKRLKKMLEELESGGVYMGMKHRSSLKRDLIRCQLPCRSKLLKFGFPVCY